MALRDPLKRAAYEAARFQRKQAERKLSGELRVDRAQVRGYEFVRRIERKLAGLCQRCPNAVQTFALCALCRKKDAIRRPNYFEDKQLEESLWQAAMGGHDRRHNGNPSKALDWALTMHRHTEQPEAV